MVAFSGVSHVALTVTDLDRSERFYTDVFGFIRLADFGVARVLLDRPSGFMLSVFTHQAAAGGPFSELNTGMDHLGFVAEGRDELVEWEKKLDALGVVYTPIRDMEFGSHLNFRDPDDIALELQAPGPLWQVAAEALAAGATREQIAAFVEEHLGPELVVR